MQHFDFNILIRTDYRVDIALVTGAGAGIGRSVCIALAAAGAHVAVTDIDASAAGRVATEVGRGEAHELDVASESQIKDVVASIANEHGRIDILVNNAGVGARTPSVDLDIERWNRALEIGPARSDPRNRAEIGHPRSEIFKNVKIMIVDNMPVFDTVY